MSLFEDLRAATADEWEAYTHHPFVEELGAGTLPLPVFQDYLAQDYLFLIQFARANALAAYTSTTLADITASAASLSAILSETALHEGLAARWGIDAASLAATPEKLATVAYTRYVLDCGHSGDLLALNVALAPCTIGYAEIGGRLAPRLGSAAGSTAAGDAAHPYAEWIAEYAGEEFQHTAGDAKDRLDDLARRALTGHRFAELVTVFRTATQLETAFWQQAMDSAVPSP